MRELYNFKYLPVENSEKIRVLFVFQSATVWPSMENLYFACKNDERYQVVLALYEDVVVEKGHLANAKEFLDNNNYTYINYASIEFDSYCPHIVFIQLPYDTSCHTPDALSLGFVNRGIRVIYVPYGNETADTQEVRRVQYENFVVENAWRVYTGTNEAYAEYRKFCRNRDSVRCVGVPKFDSIVNKENFCLCDDIKNKKQGRKLIVWKIHFPKRDATSDGPKLVTPELREYFRFLQYIEKNETLFFVILGHPKLINQDVSSLVYRDNQQMESISSFFDKAKQLENVYIDTAPDYRNTLYNGDAVIMDRSGLIIEVAMLNIPTLYLLNGEYQEKYLNYVNEILGTYESGQTCQDMINFVELQKKGIDKWHDKRKMIIKKYIPFLDGECCSRILEDIVTNVKKKDKVTKLKVLFYGCGSVYEYYMRKQGWMDTDKFEIVGVADSDSSRWDKKYLGHTIIKPTRMKEMEYDIIVITSEMFYYDIKKHLVYDLFLDERRIRRLDEFVIALQKI